MSHSQDKPPDNPRSVVLGSSFSPRGREVHISKSDVEDAEGYVVARRVRGSMEPLVSFLMNEIGLCSQGLLGCVLVPHGDKKLKTNSRVFRIVTETIPVWVIQEMGTDKQYLSTQEFLVWALRKCPQLNSLRDLPQTGSNLPFRGGPFPSGYGRTLPTPSGVGSNIGRRMVPPPSTVAHRGPMSTMGRRAPPPSTISLKRDNRYSKTVGPGDSVSVIGDVDLKFRDSLKRLESDFKHTPRIEGPEGQSFDEAEYFSRLDSLNRERANRGLPPYGGTPSNY